LANCQLFLNAKISPGLISKVVQILYCKSIAYGTPSQNTPLFSWNITPLQPTFALLSKAGPGPLIESQIILTAVGIATASRKNERQ
jgi:hypothetical protein